MHTIGSEQPWPGFQIGINEPEFDDLKTSVNTAKIHNGWFTPEAVKEAFLGIASWLTEEQLIAWTSNYKINTGKPKTVAIIMAGNIPLVGFHDFLAVFLSGNKTLVKLSSDDKTLFPALMNILSMFDPEIADWIEIREFKLDGFDAVIATGSDNSANYFESYFGKYPHIIRKNRTSVAIVNGNETKEELEELGKDVFTFFGLGCRNVSQVLIPEDFNTDRLFEAFFKFGDIINHNKYANNYDYNKAVNLMNLEKMFDNNFILLKESDQLVSPLGMLHFKRYKSNDEVTTFLIANKDKIQAIVGVEHISFGKAQQPSLTDYADGVDTMRFLTSL